MNPIQTDESYIPVWKRWLPRGGALASTVAALCCIGLPAVVSLATAIGATFLVRDETLAPILVGVLLVTFAGNYLTFRCHRSPLPMIGTIVAGAWIFVFTFVVSSGHEHHDAMSQHLRAGATGSRAGLIWLGLALLIATQILDVIKVRACSTDHA